MNKIKKKKPLYIKICPKCKSMDVEVSHQGYLSGLVAIGVPTVYRCKKCGFSSKFFPTINFNEIKKRKK